MIAADDDNRNAVAPRVVNRHRRMLETDRTVRQRHQRLAGDLEIAMRHGNADFLVIDGKEFGLLVVTIIDQRLVKAAETRSRV